MRTLRLILGDQLNENHSWFSENKTDSLYLLMEMRQETDYCHHHIQKVVAFFAAMRAFAAQLKADGHQVMYLTLHDSMNQQDLAQNIKYICQIEQISHFEYQEPDEYRLDLQLQSLAHELPNIPVKAVSSEHFLTNRTDLATFFKGKKTFLMEPFYRSMRKKFAILMDEQNEPLGGQWNFDAENRKKLPKNHVPLQPKQFVRDVTDLVEEIQRAQVQTIGKINPTAFFWPIQRSEALELLHFFVTRCLIHFGTYEDAMAQNDWSVYHSRLSFALNSKLLSPLEVVETAVSYWKKNQENITIAQIEGFVRQIIGWREYMRGIYWAKMPQFAQLNFFEHNRPLPSWYWTGKTRMNCLQKSIGQSLEKAYAHHIQRLMVIGNFSLLAGLSPDELDAWYLGIYIDAIEWVEITNTRGMSQYADGGIVGSKPYVGSANYMHKMSDYCGSCVYDKSEKVGAKACPFNSLYWDFFARHEDKLRKNPRIGMAYQTWEKFTEEQKKEIRAKAAYYLAHLEEL